VPVVVPVLSIMIVLSIYWYYCKLVFSGSSIWLGLLAAIMMNLVWIMLARWLSKPSWISFYGMIWELGLVVLTAMYPYFVKNMVVNNFFWVGVGFTILAVIFLYAGVE